jgi:hypothetical protein
MNMYRALSIAFAVCGLVGCRDNPSYFENLGTFVQANRIELTALVSDIQKQTSLSRVIWSEREFITVIYRDGTSRDGYADDKTWSAEVTNWIARLKAAGCHGFDDGGPEDVTSLYLDIQSYIAVPSAGHWEEAYAAWARAGKNPHGLRCVDLGRGWYLTADKS